MDTPQGNAPGTDIVRIPFHDDYLTATEINGKPFIVLRPAIEAMGLDYSGQHQRLLRTSWATMCVIPTVAADGKTRDMVAVDVRTFLMLLAGVDESRVAEGLREKIASYQREVADVIEAYFTKGGAINPRASRDQLEAIIHTSGLQLDVLSKLAGYVHPGWLETKMRHVAARALGEEPEVDPATRPLTVGEYLESRAMSPDLIRHVSGSFGKSLAAWYRSNHGGAEPLKADRFIDGALRAVAVYTEADRPLFDQAWIASGFGDQS